MESEYIVCGKPCNSILCRRNGRVPPIISEFAWNDDIEGSTFERRREREKEASNEDGGCSLIRSRLR